MTDGPQRNPVQNAVLDYLKAHPDAEITLDELEQALKPSPRTSISSAAANLTRNLDNVHRVGHGIYMFSQKKAAAKESMLLVEIIDRKPDGSMLVKGEDGALFGMKEIRW